MQSKPIRILSVEDHPIVREGLRAVISSQPDMELVAQASNGPEALKLFREHKPDITLMDLWLPGTDGIDTLIAIRDELKDTRAIMLTTSECDGNIQHALRAGASGYILKSMSNAETLNIIRSVYSDNRGIPAGVAARLAEYWCTENLTEREVDVLGLIRDGNRNKQIADMLGIAETTVKFKNLVAKLGANDRVHAVTIALRRGLLRG